MNSFRKSKRQKALCLTQSTQCQGHGKKPYQFLIVEELAGLSLKLERMSLRQTWSLLWFLIERQDWHFRAQSVSYTHLTLPTILRV